MLFASIPGTVCAATSGCMEQKGDMRQQQAASVFVNGQNEDAYERNKKLEQEYSTATERLASNDKYDSVIQWLSSGGDKKEYFAAKRQYEEEQRKMREESERAEQENTQHAGAAGSVQADTVPLFMGGLLIVAFLL